MKRLTIITLVAISGCSRQQQQPSPIPDTFDNLDAWQAHATEQIKSWVPLGTPATNAQKIMEEHSFTTISNSPSFVECYSRSMSLNDPVEQNIEAWFYLNDGKVSGERVFTSLKGP